MSRRAKLAFLGIVLVLYGIAVTFAMYSWRPKSPVRISLAPNQEVPSGEPASTYFLTPYDIVVENTGHAVIHFHGATLDDISIAARGIYPKAVIAPPEWVTSRPATAGTFWSIPAHSSIRCTVLPVGGGDLPIAQRGRLTVEYAWRSPLNLRYVQIREWFRSHAPSQLQEFLGEPDYFQDSTPLEVGALGPRSGNASFPNP